MAMGQSAVPGYVPRVLACLALAMGSVAASRADGSRPDLAHPDQFRCVGRNHFSGAIDTPIEKHTDSDTWTFAAYFVDPVKGTPTIVYGPGFRTVGPLMQAFIRRHECQHANGVRDVIAANCAALAQMRAQGLTTEQEAQLERWHMAQGRLDPSYGGSGAAFWDGTVRCAAAAR